MKIKYNTSEKRRQIRICGISAAVVVLLCLLAVALIAAGADRKTQTMAAIPPPTLVIDAGHGGIDGGAISDDGTKESDINLAVALRLECIVRFCGQKTRMTRLDDSRKTDMIGYSEREDLKCRAELVNSTPNAVLISIHQNDFPTAQPKGAQVFYAAFGDSEILGKTIQENLIAQLDPQNRRLAAPAPRELYLTANTSCPAVLVECGFMSNNFEVLKLKDGNYQTSIAVAIAASYLSYLNHADKL